MLLERTRLRLERGVSLFCRRGEFERLRLEDGFLLLQLRRQRRGGGVARVRGTPGLRVAQRRRRPGELRLILLQSRLLLLQLLLRRGGGGTRVSGVRGDPSLRRRRPRLGVAKRSRRVGASRLRRGDARRRVVRARLFRSRRLARARLRFTRRRRRRRRTGERALRLGEARRLRLQRLRLGAERAFHRLEFRGERGRVARARRGDLGERGGFRLRNGFRVLEARGEPRLGVAERVRRLDASRLRRRGSSRGFVRAPLLRLRGLARLGRHLFGGVSRERRDPALLERRLRARARVRRRLAERLELRARRRVAPRRTLRLRPRGGEAFAQRRRGPLQIRNHAVRRARLLPRRALRVAQRRRFLLPRRESRRGGDQLGARRGELRRRLRRRGRRRDRVLDPPRFVRRGTRERALGARRATRRLRQSAHQSRDARRGRVALVLLESLFSPNVVFFFSGDADGILRARRRARGLAGIPPGLHIVRPRRVGIQGIERVSQSLPRLVALRLRPPRRELVSRDLARQPLDDVAVRRVALAGSPDHRARGSGAFDGRARAHVAFRSHQRALQRVHHQRRRGHAPPPLFRRARLGRFHGVVAPVARERHQHARLADVLLFLADVRDARQGNAHLQLVPRGGEDARGRRLRVVREVLVEDVERAARGGAPQAAREDIPETIFRRQRENGVRTSRSGRLLEPGQAYLVAQRPSLDARLYLGQRREIRGRERGGHRGAVPVGTATPASNGRLLVAREEKITPSPSFARPCLKRARIFVRRASREKQ